MAHFGPKPPPRCPRCQGETSSRGEPDPRPGDSPLAPRRRYYWDCPACAESWENCGVCGNGALLREPAWNAPELLTIRCRGGCGWSCTWRPSP